MVIDTSAVVAIILQEPGHELLLEKLAERSNVGLGGPILVESAVVLSARLRSDARGLLARLLAEAGIAVVPFGEVHFATAVDAWLRFGEGRHPVSLNFGDCLSYATARVADQPLLRVGDDFQNTDIELA